MRHAEKSWIFLPLLLSVSQPSDIEHTRCKLATQIFPRLSLRSSGGLLLLLELEQLLLELGREDLLLGNLLRDKLLLGNLLLNELLLGNLLLNELRLRNLLRDKLLLRNLLCD